MVEATTMAVQPMRKQSAAPAGEESVRTNWLLCRAGTKLCAIPLAHVIEVMRPLPIEAVSGAPGYVLGLCIIRGAAVPVIDTGLLIGAQATKPERLVTIRTGERTAALAAESILGIGAIRAEAFNELPPLLRESAHETIAAIGTLDAELLFVLRTARIVPAEMFDRLELDRASS